MTWLLLILGLLLFVMQAVAMKKIKITSLREDLLLTALFCGVAAIALWIYTAAAHNTISGITLLYGILFGILFIITFTVYFFALHEGPMSYTVFFCAASMIIPALAGTLVFGQAFKWVMGAGIALFLIAFFLISVPGAPKNPQEKKANAKWMWLCFFTWLLNGGLSVLVTAQQTAMTKALKAAGTEITAKTLEPSSMTTIAFTVAAILSFIVYFCLLPGDRKKDTEISAKKDFKLMGSYWLPVLSLAVGNAGGNFVLTYLSGNGGAALGFKGGVPSAILFPFVQGGMMVVVTLYSSLFLKEKINKWGILGILLGVVAIVVINL